MAHTVFPFANFLEVLRSRGIPIGLNDYARVAQLLSRWAESDIQALSIAIAALLGRSQSECKQIRELFLDTYERAGTDVATRMEAMRPRSASTLSQLDGQGRRPRPGIRARVLLGSIALLSLLLGVLAWEALRSGPLPNRPPGRPDMAEEYPILPAAPPRMGNSQFRKQIFPREGPLAYAPAALAFFGVAVFGSLILIFAMRRRARQQWALARQVIQPGPTQYALSAEYLHPPLQDGTLARLTTILGCEHTREAGLNLSATLEASLQSAAFMKLVYYRSTPPGELLLLVDESSEMEPWKYKVAMMIDAMRRRGIAIKEWTFDAEPSVVRSRTSGQALPLTQLASQTAQLPLWILSIGGGICTHDGVPRRWVESVRSWRARAFLTPITLQSLWPESLTKLSMRCFPLNENGLLGAAVAVMERAPSMQPMRRQPFVPVITARDCELLRRLLCLVPDPDVYYAFALRLRFLPDVPEEIILYLLAEQPHVGGVRLEQSLAEQAQLLQALLEESPQLEREARGFLLQVLHDAEPRPGTLAHMRWRLALTQQRLWLASTAQARAPFLQELKEIRHLNQGRLGVEAEAALDRAQRRARLISLRERALAKHSVSGLLRKWSRPRLRDVVYAGAAVAVFFAFLFSFGRRILRLESRMLDESEIDAGIDARSELVDLMSAGSLIEFSERDMGLSPRDLSGPPPEVGSTPYLKSLPFASPKHYQNPQKRKEAELWHGVPIQTFRPENSLVRLGRVIRRDGPKPYLYSVSSTEVTQVQFTSIMKFNPSKHIGAHLPVERVTWFEAIKFANALSNAENLKPCYIINKERVEWSEGARCQGYRLPTFNEWWTAACRPDETLTDSERPILPTDICVSAYSQSVYDYNYYRFMFYDIDDIAWTDQNSGRSAHPVGLKRPNIHNLYDVLGNVEEWLWDNKHTDTPSERRDMRLIIGGSFLSNPRELIRLRTQPMEPRTAIPSIGFRVVRTVAY